uniref:Uncharacterized protein n=1 Tax=Quercus lobata TaxID=97700 RepID=A0A7N2M9N9_QUELO
MHRNASDNVKESFSTSSNSSRDVKKKLKNVERDVFSWEVYILDLSNIGGSGDSLLDKLLECSTSMNSGKASPRAFVADGKICMVGSTIKMSISDICKIKDLDLKNFAYFEIYDPIDDKWTKLPNPPIRNVNTSWVGHIVVGRKAVLVAWHIAAIAPLVEEEEIKEEEEGQIEEIEEEEEEEIEEEKVKEEEEAKKVHHTRSLFKPARLFKNHHIHFVSEEMRKDAFVNFPPQLQSSSSLLHMGNRHFCYVRTGMPPHSVYGGDHAVQDENIRFICIAIFHAPGQTYEKDEIRRFQAELLHSAHYVVNTLFPSNGYIWSCFSPGLV